ncbi:MAG: hypothetical protein NTZ78_04155 [Candidatus Aureabacteria bacterium]|nr:hypothetical protein [Candidatus Auribacterota bacterium]
MFKLGLESPNIKFWYKAILSFLIFLLFSAALFATYEVTEVGPRVKLGPFVRKSKQIKWDDIELIYDDNFSSAHFYRFKLRGRSYWSTFVFQNGVTNYKDFLREAIMRVRPDTVVEEKILQLVSFTHADIGKLYRPPLAT